VTAVSDDHEVAAVGELLLGHEVRDDAPLDEPEDDATVGGTDTARAVGELRAETADDYPFG